MQEGQEMITYMSYGGRENVRWGTERFTSFWGVLLLTQVFLSCSSEGCCRKWLHGELFPPHTLAPRLLGNTEGTRQEGGTCSLPLFLAELSSMQSGWSRAAITLEPIPIPESARERQQQAGKGRTGGEVPLCVEDKWGDTKQGCKISFASGIWSPLAAAPILWEAGGCSHTTALLWIYPCWYPMPFIEGRRCGEQECMSATNTCPGLTGSTWRPVYVPTCGHR